MRITNNKNINFKFGLSVLILGGLFPGTGIFHWILRLPVIPFLKIGGWIKENTDNSKLTR